MIVDHLTFNFPILREKKLSNKTRRGVSIIHMEEALIPHKYEMETTCHHDPISYGKSIFAFKLFFLGFCCFIFWSFSIFSFLYFHIYHFTSWFVHLFFFLAFPLFFFPHRYNQVDKHLRAETLQSIINGEFKAIACFIMMKLLRRKKIAFNKTKVFFFLLSGCFFGLQKFHENLIGLLLLLRGCAIDDVSSHARIGGEFYLFYKKLKNYHCFLNCFYFARVSFWKC